MGTEEEGGKNGVLLYSGNRGNLNIPKVPKSSIGTYRGGSGRKYNLRKVLHR